MKNEQFERELEIFRTELEQGTQFFYTYVALHMVASKRKTVQSLLNMTPLFWNTILGSLQSSTFIVLGRIFEPEKKSRHNLQRLLAMAHENNQIFSKVALGKRKKATGLTDSDVNNYLLDVYEPSPEDFRRLQVLTRKWRKIYESKYSDIRHKIFAHKGETDPPNIEAMFAKTNIQEMQRMFMFLGSLHMALWQLFFNGLKPVLRRRRYSVKRILDSPLPEGHVGTVQERITREAGRFLLDVAALAKPKALNKRNYFV
ncbi:MAG: hypothetical protein ABSA86_00080 [Oryzomonas sp.]|jgi:hypothetical protein